MSTVPFATRLPPHNDAMLSLACARAAKGALDCEAEVDFAAQHTVCVQSCTGPRAQPISVPPAFSMPLTPSPSQSACLAARSSSGSGSGSGPGSGAPVTSCCDFAFRIYEFNRRLQLHEAENRWWEALIQEFFEDDAVLSLSLCLEDGPKKFTIGRALIGRYFRSIYESGVIEYFIQLYHPRESFRTATLTLECENTQIVTQHIRPMFSKVVCDGHLVLEFNCNELMRIRSWNFTARAHHEFIPRNMLALHEPTLVNHLSRNITRCGVTANTLNFLKLCTVLEPMQLLMARQKTTDMSPRDSLRSVIQERWQTIMQPAKSPVVKGKRNQKNKDVLDDTPLQNGPVHLQPSKVQRKKKSLDDLAELVNKKRQKADDKMNQNITGYQKQNVMVVGEPKLLSAFYAEEERAITRVENLLYDSQNQACFDGGQPRDCQQFRAMQLSHASTANCCATSSPCSEWNTWDGPAVKNCGFVQPIPSNPAVHQPYRYDRFGQQNNNNSINPNLNMGTNIAGHFSETWQVPIPNGHGNMQF